MHVRFTWRACFGSLDPRDSNSAGEGVAKEFTFPIRLQVTTAMLLAGGPEVELLLS